MTDLLDAAVSEAPVAIVILRGPELVVEVANTLALRNWGRASDTNIIGRPLFEAVPELANQGFEAVLQKVRTTAEPFIGHDMPLTVVDEATGRTEQRYIDRTYRRLAESDRILAIGTDVTESVKRRRNHAAELRAQEDRLERMRGAGLFATIEVQTATGALRADPHAAELFAIAPVTTYGALLERVIPEDRDRAAAMLRGEGKLDVEVRIATPVGIRWVAIRGYIEPGTTSFFALVGDTTPRREAEIDRERLRADVQRAEARLHAQFMQAPVAVSVVTGPTLVYEHANPLYLEMVGRSGVVGRTMYEVFPELPANAPIFQTIEAVMRTGQAYRADEYRVAIDRGRGPEDTYFKFSTQPIHGLDGRIDAVMTVAVDVTGQVRARQDLTLADQRKDEFLAMLAHELRNPMAAVSTAIQLLEHVEGDPARSAKYRETARRQMANLVRLVDDLLDVSRITRGKIDLQMHELDLGAIVQQALAATRPAFEARGHELAVTLASGGFRMRGDATRLEQIVVNLLTNAAKYTDPNGCVEVRLVREHGRAALHVRDSGRGIPADMLERVFDLFVQVAPSIDRRTGGLGLGLTLVKRLAEMHGGTVTARSEGQGKGSEFVVTLPILERLPLGTPTHLAAVEIPAMQVRTILLVEDADDVRDTLSAYLRGLGHEVHVARDGIEGIARMAEVKPDVAFVDIGLPALDGYEVARRTRAAGTAPYLVALTGYGGDEARALAREAGFDLHLTKPVDLATLPRVIERLGRS